MLLFFTVYCMTLYVTEEIMNFADELFFSLKIVCSMIVNFGDRHWARTEKYVHKRSSNLIE
jgi:hypothetical protein